LLVNFAAEKTDNKISCLFKPKLVFLHCYVLIDYEKNITNKVQSNLSTTATLWTPKKRLLFRGGRYSEVPPIKLVLIWDVWGSGWLLLTGGRCSEVVVNAGLTVFPFLFS